MVCLFCRSVPGDATTLNIKVGGRGELQVCWIRSHARVVQTCFLQQSSMKRAVVDVRDERRGCRAWLAWRAWRAWPTSRAAPPPHLARFAHLEHNRRPSADQIARAAQHIQLICALRYRQIAGSSSPGQTAPEKHRSALAGDPERAPPPLGGGFNPGHGNRLAASTGTRAGVDVRDERGACRARRAWFTGRARPTRRTFGSLVAPTTLGAPDARGTSVHLACPTRPAYLAPPASFARLVRNRARRRRNAANP